MIVITKIFDPNNVGMPQRQLTVLEKKTVTSLSISSDSFIYYQNDEPAAVPEPVNEILNEKLKYDQRVIDGQSAYLMLMAELRLNSITNNLPREVNKEIEEKLESVKSQVIIGQWISAREKLDAVPVGGYLTQELYDRVKTALDNYIAQNY